MFEFFGIDDSFLFDKEQLLLNCTVLLNAELRSATLSSNTPMVRLTGGEKSADRWQFLHLIRPSVSQLFKDEPIEIRKIATDRFNAERLVKLATTLISRFSSDYYAFQQIESLRDGAFMDQFYTVLKKMSEGVAKASKTTTPGLYLMLLQKREENAIALAATANNAKIIDEAIADDIPISPKRSMIYLIALVLGLGIPVGIIYLVELTKFKIEGRADVEKLTSVPVVGDIPLTDEKNDKNGSIAVFENKNNLMSETFRNIRTNLQFMLDNDQKVILVTSTVSGEGKSFVSANLAISLSLLGKKVVIVGLDIRKPGLNKVFSLSNKEKGITQYLSNPETDLMELVQPSDINKNLFILPGGAVPPNPTELLARNGLDKAIEILKQNFDYVIMDTAPIGMVTDTLLVGRVADLSVYVCRADYTHKAEYTLINELAIEKKLSKLCTVINGVDLKKRKYGYYYGYGKYGKYYGYGKRYGYGYGYGEK